jgi:colicin import membrane protein
MTHLSPQQLSAHLDSALHGASLQTVETHLEMCEKCRDELAALTLQDQMLGEALRGDTDRELFDLIGLRVQSDVHPQRARALEKSILELERTRDERRRHAQAVARQVQEQRQQAPDIDETPGALPARSAPAGSAAPLPARPTPPVVPAISGPVAGTTPAPPTPAPPTPAPAAPVRFAPTHRSPDPPPAAEAAALASPSSDSRRRALDEARARAEAEARAFALESERARAEAESRVLEQAALRARHQAAARRRAEEESRTRVAASARAEAERLARAAEAAQVAAETSARDALAAQTRAETRAVAAVEAQRQARRKAEEARRLEIELTTAAGAGTHSKAPRADDARKSGTPDAGAVEAVGAWPTEQEFPAEVERPAHSRRSAPPARRESRRSTALALAASLLILLAAVWFAIGRQFVRIPAQELPVSPAAEAPAAGDAGVTPSPAPSPAPEPTTPVAPTAAAEEGHGWSRVRRRRGNERWRKCGVPGGSLGRVGGGAGGPRSAVRHRSRRRETADRRCARHDGGRGRGRGHGSRRPLLPDRAARYPHAVRDRARLQHVPPDGERRPPHRRAERDAPVRGPQLARPALSGERRPRRQRARPVAASAAELRLRAATSPPFTHLPQRRQQLKRAAREADKPFRAMHSADSGVFAGAARWRWRPRVPITRGRRHWHATTPAVAAHRGGLEAGA